MEADIRTRISSLPDEKREALLRRVKLHRPAEEPGSEHYDVVVLGGGMAGLTLALQLKKARPATRVVVAERQPHPVPEVTHKVGESTVEIAAHYLRDTLELEEHLRSRQLKKFGLRMFFSNHDNSDISQRVEIGSTVFPPLRTYQLDRGRLENALGDAIARSGVDFLADAKVTAITLESDGAPHRVRVLRDGVEREVAAQWVVDASGRNRLLQGKLGLAKSVGHKANAVWFRVAHPIDIKDWTDDPAWHARVNEGDRALSTNHLMGPGYWVWLIRLASGSISIGIVADPDQHSFDEMNRFERALDWLRRHEPQCAQAVDQHREKVQDFRVMKDYSYSCRQVYSGDGRWCLTGDAGVFLDPLYSPGIDMIAIGNGLITDLVCRSLDGQDVTHRAAIHDRLFLNVAEIWLAIYQHQYTLMGNPQVMISKIIWDTAFYWGVFGHLYFHDRFRTLIDDPVIANGLARLAELSSRVQVFFREWNAIDEPDLDIEFVDLFAPLNFMVELHEGMAAPLTPAQFETRFAENIRTFEQLAGQLVCTVIEAYANRSERRVVFDQIRRWQTDRLVAELITIYRRNGKSNPTSDGWMTLARRHVGGSPMSVHPSWR